MRTLQKQIECDHCGQLTLHQTQIEMHELGCLFHLVNLVLTVMTAGIWLVVWIGLALLAKTDNGLRLISRKRWICQRCGREY